MGVGSGPRGIGKYELHERLGRGGMAEVWKAWDNQLGRYVAIKILHADLQNDPDFMKRFIREARAIASLHHPNIIKIHDFQISYPPESETTFAYMVMDYVEGITLADYIRTTSSMGQFPSASNIVYLFSAISNAIDYAHQHGMIHRDIKPANILLDRRSILDFSNITNLPGEPILTDFGIVKLLNTSTVSLSGSWLGTPLYISPEQARGGSGNELSDIYSMGVILYEICTGVRPFTGETTYAIILQHIQTLPIPPAQINPNISPPLSNVILRSLAKDPQQRFANASTMAEALAQAFGVPIPEGLYSSNKIADYSSDLDDRNIALSGAPGSLTPSTPSSPFLGESTPQFHEVVPISSLQSMNSPGITPVNDLSNVPGLMDVLHNRSDIPQTIPSPTATNNRQILRTFGGQHRAVFVALIALLIFALVGAGIASFFYIRTQQSSSSAGNQIIGHAFYISTGQINDNSTQGLNNELQINVSSIPTLPAGKGYYAWLLNDKDHSPQVSLLLGKLLSNTGSINYLYQGDQQQTNLLATYSRLLITVEDANSVPGHPSTDKHTWRYYAELPQIPSVTTKIGALDYFRYLLSDDSRLTQVNLHGGLNTRFYKNTQQVVAWTASISNSKDPAVIRHLLISILDYLDGAPYVQNDVPPGTLLLADPTLSQIPIIDVVQSQVTTSYLERISNVLASLISSSGVTPQTLALANQINLALSNRVKMWLDQTRQDAKQLVSMSDTQLMQPSSKSILNDMQTQVNYAFDGQIDLATGQEREGITQLSADIQRLATFDITVYKP
jgi:serine/threonine protein kinase